MADRYFSYGERELAYLRKKDKKLAAVIDQLGYVRRPVIPDLFQALVNAILGQQISSKAADTVWQRFQDVCSPVTPEHVLCFSKEDLQACGTTFRKIGYIQDISHEFVSGRLQTEIVSAMPDNLFCQILCQLPGIGQWTAEMLLIHCLERPDVLSYGDLAILRGLRMIYRRNITKDQFRRYQKRYSPYGTVASIYLWAVSAGAIPGLTDSAETVKKAVGKMRKS